ncbi:hypothetical protein D931_01988 [Enterococcus faecium 13.SD.W.09]|jgi:hypothetical protein|nr:hypothetical protein D931_01988 [Enterococcus faecium 13.SD.W.09]
MGERRLNRSKKMLVYSVHPAETGRGKILNQLRIKENKKATRTNKTKKKQKNWRMNNEENNNHNSSSTFSGKYGTRYIN